MYTCIYNCGRSHALLQVVITRNKDAVELKNNNHWLNN